MTDKTRKTVRGVMLLLFLTGIFSISLSVVQLVTRAFAASVCGWVIIVLELAAAVLLMGTGLSRWFRVTVVCAAAIAALEIAAKIMEGTSAPGRTVVGVLSLVIGGIRLYSLYNGTGELMRAEGFPEEERSGRFNGRMIIALYGCLIVVWTLMNVAVAAMAGDPGDIGYSLFATFSVVIVLLGIVLMVVAVANLVIRLTFFWRCRKKLGTSPPDATEKMP